jgi:GMP synthase-like glutamine amidotransferase
MDDILVLQHDPLEGPGNLAQLLERHQLAFRYIRVFQGEMPTEGWEEIRALVVLGGPMSVREEERYPFLRWEKAVIRTAIKQGLPILGICLGAQLIASAAGAEVYEGNIQEIGWYPISLTPEGQMDTLLGYLPEKPTVFQWHSDGFDLPRGAQRLAGSLHYDNQAFRIGRYVYGLQFHLEVTPKMIERWMEERWKELAQVPYISPDKIRADTRSYCEALNYYGERFFSEFVRRISAFKARREEGHPAKT